MERALKAHRPSDLAPASAPNEANVSGVSWAAVVGGAFVTAAMWLILLALGAGMGLSSVSPWSSAGWSASTIGVAGIAWLILVQIISSSMGGYLTGRLRTKWAHIHADEVHFRDTAHGFLTWAVALVATGAFLASAAAVMAGATAAAAADGAERVMGVRGQSQESGPNEYYVDALFRSDSAKADANGVSVRGEARRVLENGLRQETTATGDGSHLAQLVAARTGLRHADADKRVSDILAEARQAADTARRVASHTLSWAFLAFLIGAFCASVAATIGGRQRDRVAAA